VRHILIDNGGCGKSVNLWRKMERKGLLKLIENETNRGHGPALNQGLELVETPYAFLLDSDTRTKEGGFLEKMLDLFSENWRLFAAGWLRQVSAQNGVALRKGDKARDVLDYIHPHACLLDVAKFRQVRPFTVQGAPALMTMLDARARHWKVADFPIADYIWHKGSGTRGLFGGRVRIKTDEKPRQWKWYRI